MSSSGRVQTGLDRLLGAAGDSLRGKRLGLIANPTAVDVELRHAVDLMDADPRFDLRVLFGPEHGLRGAEQDMIAVDSGRDSRTGLPVHSLYGDRLESLGPPEAALAEIETLVFDIQDVGSRYYTYVWTLVLAMRACARVGVEVVVLDRPNPIGGTHVEGGRVDAGYESFVGLCSLPNRHGMTVGEIARWAREMERLDVALEVISVSGWRRNQWQDETGLPWVMPSPNMPTCDTALVYPGMCLVEGTELSEGRGTTRPFEISGAPFVDGHALAAALGAEELPGVTFRPLVFRPCFHKHNGVECGGVQLHVTDREAFRPYLTGVAFLRAVHDLWPGDFAWRERPYEFVTDKSAIDLLTGSDQVRLGIERGDTLQDLQGTWDSAERAFASSRDKWLIYP